ncbi:hypothetical protein AMECASPLE_023198 [Ameca splendens]|uniref:Uncharacterized protein n=1 Tax=Ameca splendens TaxID=208324 RepID=A0ABV0ZPZ9_9TELE
MSPSLSVSRRDFPLLLLLAHPARPGTVNTTQKYTHSVRETSKQNINPSTPESPTHPQQRLGRDSCWKLGMISLLTEILPDTSKRKIFQGMTHSQMVKNVVKIQKKLITAVRRDVE